MNASPRTACASGPAPGAASYRRRDASEASSPRPRLRSPAQGRARGRPGGHPRRVAAARERAATERAERVRKALGHLPELERPRAGPASRSTGPRLDHRSRGDGDEDGRRRLPAGLQRPVRHRHREPGHRRTRLSTAGTDHGQFGPMVGQLDGRYGQRPGRAPRGRRLRSRAADIAALDLRHDPLRSRSEARGPDPRPAGPLPTTRRRWPRGGMRMGTAGGQGALQGPRRDSRVRERPSPATAASCRFPVRGPDKARAIALWFALAHNLMRTVVLREAVAAKLIPGPTPAGLAYRSPGPRSSTAGSCNRHPHAERTETLALRPARRPPDRFVLRLLARPPLVGLLGRGILPDERRDQVVELGLRIVAQPAVDLAWLDDRARRD